MIERLLAKANNKSWHRRWTAILQAAMNATKTIPIVMVGSGLDPVGAGLVESIARPGGNVTGITNLAIELGGKRLDLLKEAVPKLSCVAVLYNRTTRSNVFELNEVLPSAARALRLTIQPWEVRAAEDFDRVFCCDGEAALGWALRASGRVENRRNGR